MRSAILASLAYCASATTISVQIGAGGLKFKPDSITAAVGDIVQFSWPSSIPHDVVSGDFAKPCQPNGLIASPVEMGGSKDFFVTINSTDPMFLYCAVADHCNDGMVMAINPSSEQTLAMYQSGAGSANKVDPSMVNVGGVLADVAATASGSASTMAGTATMGASGMMTTGSAVAAASTSATDNSAAIATGVPALVGAAAVGLAMLI